VAGDFFYDFDLDCVAVDGPPDPQLSTLSLHDALPICLHRRLGHADVMGDLLVELALGDHHEDAKLLRGEGRQPIGELGILRTRRSEEHTSELQSLAYLVCRLLLEKKNDGLEPGLVLLD